MQVQIFDPNAKQLIVTEIVPVQDVLFSGHGFNIRQIGSKIKGKYGKEFLDDSSVLPEQA